MLRCISPSLKGQNSIESQYYCVQIMLKETYVLGLVGNEEYLLRTKLEMIT